MVMIYLESLSFLPHLHTLIFESSDAVDIVLPKMPNIAYLVLKALDEVQSLDVQNFIR